VSLHFENDNMISHTKFLGILAASTSEMARDYADIPFFMNCLYQFSYYDIL
jgi:hypothetical protein